MKQGCKNCGNFIPSGWGDEVPTRWNGNGRYAIPEFVGLSRAGFLMRSAGKCRAGNNLRDEHGTEYIPPEEAAEMFEAGTGCEDWIPTTRRGDKTMCTSVPLEQQKLDRCPYERAIAGHRDNLKKLMDGLKKARGEK